MQARAWPRGLRIWRLSWLLWRSSRRWSALAGRCFTPIRARRWAAVGHWGAAEPADPHIVVGFRVVVSRHCGGAGVPWWQCCADGQPLLFLWRWCLLQQHKPVHRMRGLTHAARAHAEVVSDRMQLACLPCGVKGKPASQRCKPCPTFYRLTHGRRQACVCARMQAFTDGLQLVSKLLPASASGTSSSGHAHAA